MIINLYYQHTVIKQRYECIESRSKVYVKNIEIEKYQQPNS